MRTTFRFRWAVVIVCVIAPAIFASKAVAGTNNPTDLNNDQGNTFVPPGAMGQITDPDPAVPLFKGKNKGGDQSKGAGNAATPEESHQQSAYQGRVKNAQHTIEKGEAMMRSANNDPSKPGYKKGKVLKDIGEKDLADLKANNPTPSHDDKSSKKTKPDSL